MVAFLPFAALFVLRGPRRVRGTKGSASISLGGLPPAIALGACGLMFLAAIFTKSRAGFLGMAVMALVLVWHARKIRRGLGIAALVATVIVVPLLPSSFWGRMVSIVQPEEDPTGSRAARRTVMTEAAMVFLERPLTGIGAGQFKNYNPPGKKERWREAHDVWLQVASETGIVGLLVFVYLVWAAVRGATWSRKRAWALVNRHKQPTRPWTSNKPSPPPLSAPALAEARILHLQATALVASLAGWIVCATFASVAYNWTFYYLLGLCIATRRLAGERELS
jgi:O-antigen ligase